MKSLKKKLVEAGRRAPLSRRVTGAQLVEGPSGENEREEVSPVGSDLGWI